MGEEYKISLGVDIDVSDLQSQINKAADKVNPIPIKVEIENLAEIKKQIQNLGDTKGNAKVAIPIDTKSIEQSLTRVADAIDDIKNSLGSLKSESGMKNLLSSINQIATALGKAEDESQTLVNSLNALSKKDFSINFGVKLGGSNSVSNNAKYGDIVKSEIIPELKRQEQAIGRYLAQYYKTDELSALNKLAGSSFGGIGGVIEILDKLEQPIKKGDSLNDRMREFKDFFNTIKKAASIQGVDLSPVLSNFDKQADELIQGAHDIRNGTKEAEDSVNKFEDVLKRAFGGGISSEQLDAIVSDLREIKTALTDLSAETPLNNLKKSFDSLSQSITQLIQNCNKISVALNDVGDTGANVGANVGNEFANGFNNSMESVQSSATETSGVISNLKATLETMKLDRSSIDAITRDIEELGFEVTNASVKMKDGNFDITVKGIDSLGRAVTEMRHLDSATGEISGLGRTISQSFSTSDDVIREVNQEMANFVKLQSQIGNMRTKIGKLELAGGNENQIAELKRQLEDLENTYNDLMQTFSKKLVANADIISMDDVAKFDDEIIAATQRTENELNRLEAEYADTKAKVAKGIEIDLKTGKFTSQVDKMHSDAKKLSTVTDDLKRKLSTLDTAQNAMDSAFRSGSVDEQIKAYNEYKAALADVKNQLDINKRAEQQAFNTATLEQSKSRLSLDMSNWLRENSAAAKDFGGKIKELQAQIDNCDKATLTNLRAQFNNIKKEAQLAGKNTQSLGDKLKTQLSKYSSYLSVASAFSYAWQGLRDMFQQVVAIDSAMTELKKVTDESDASYSKFLSNAATRSRELGTTIDGLVASTADFARLGYGFEDSQKLAEVANIYAVVGDEIEGVEDATQSLVSTMAAFKDEMNGLSDSDFALSIVDKMNEVANNYSISSGGIGEALQRSASSMAAANNTLDETIAMITAANEVAQNPDKVGNAMKTISMRIRAAKTELEEAGESTDGMAASTASLRAEIKALSGVDIMLNENTFKSTYQVMDELSQKWADLSDIAQATIIELMAGKHQGNIFSSLMANFDTARDALETSLNSSGSAMREHEKWQQSLEAQINKLKAAWQGLSQAFLKSDFLHGALEAVIKLLDGITWLIDKFGTLPTLLGTVAAGFSLFKNKGFLTFDKESKSMQLFGDSLLGLKANFGKVSTAITTYNSNLSKSQGLQNAYVNAVNKQNNSLGQYLSGLNGAKASFGGYIRYLISAKASTIGLQIATTALNAALTMGLSFAIQFIAEGIMKLINADKELAESVEETTSKFKEEHKALSDLKSDYDTSNESSMVSKYEKLSKGVDSLGRNVSLTSEEYSEYQSIVNKIAEQIPSLVSGYDSQGNALLSVKGNVEQLTEAYEKLIHAQNQKILTNTGDIEKDFANTIKKTSGTDWWSNGHGFWAGLLGTTGFAGKLLNYELKGDTAQGLKDLLNAADDKERKKILNKLRADGYSGEEIRDALKSAGVKNTDIFADPIYVLERTLKEDPQKIKGIVDNYYSQFADAVEEQKTIAQAKLSEAFDISGTISGLNYGNISEELQALAYQVVNSLDLDFFTKLQEQGKTVEQWTTELLNQLNTISKAKGEYIENAFELQTQFNGGDIDYGDYIDKLREVETIIDGLDLKDEAKTQLKISLGLDENGVVDQYDSLINRLTSKEIGLNDKVARNFVDDLSAEELAVLVDIVPNLEAGATIDEIQALIKEKLAEEFEFDIKVQTEGIEALNTALAESRSAVGLTAESIAALKARYEDLDGFNAAALFEKTATGIRLNNDELSRLEEQYINTNKLEIDKNLNSLIEKYNDLTDEIKGCTDAQKKEELQLQANAYKDKIDELSTLASQYDGLTSAFTKWQNALNGAEEGDNYDSVFENLEAMKELDDKKLYGTDKYKTFAQLMSYEDLSTANIDEIGNAFDKGYKKAERYFTEGKKGSSNFLKDLQSINSEWAHINKNGDWEVDINAEEAAKKLGISVEAVLLLLDKLKDYGIKVEVEDSSVNNLQTKIEKTEAKLKELGQSPVDINVDIEASSANLSKIESEIAKAKAKIAEINNSSVSPEVKTAQLEDARAKLEALIQKKQEASQPAFMNLNTSQVNASLVDALDKIKEYQNALNELNKLKELKDAGIAIDDSEIDSAQKKIDDCAKAIQGLDGDVKVAIGLEEDGSIDSIKKAFEEGKVKIDANTDPALTKIEQLAENVERIEDKDVTINVAVNGLDKVKELNKQIDLATDIDGDIDKLSEYVDNAKELSKLGNNITSYVTAEVKGNVIDTKEYKLDNLKVFGESAKEVKELGTFTSKVTANVEGNVIETKEGKLDNLKVFTDSAKDIKEFKGDITSKITADIDGDVFDKNESTINNLEVFIDSAKGIKEIEGDITSNITANTLGSVFTDKERNIDNLDVYIESAKGIKDIEGNIVSNITANVDGSVFTDSERTIDNLEVFVNSAKGIKDFEGDIISNITANTLGSVFTDSERTTDNLKTFIESANGIKDIEGDIVSNITANTLGSVFNDKERSIDNLKVFIESAKGIKDIEGNIVSNITANTLGDVFTDKERSIDNLKVFTESAKGIKEIEGDIVSNITANTLGSVFTNPERETNNLKVFVDSAKGIRDIEGDIVSNITANTLGSVFTDKEKSIDNLKVFIDSAKGIKEIEGNISSNITANVSGNVLNTKENKIDNLKVFADSAKDVKSVGSPTSSVTANVNGNVINISEDKIDNLGVFATNAKPLKGIGNFSSSVSANATGNAVEGEGVSSRLSSLSEFKSIVSGMTNQAVSVSVTAKVDSENVNAAIDLLKKVSNSGVFKDYKATVQVGATISTIDDTMVKNYQAPKKDGKVAYSVDSESSVFTWTAPSKDGVVNYSASVEALTDAQKHKTGTITYKAKITGFPVVNGTANANGTAFANGTSGKAFKQGDWGVKKTTTALTGELGQELVVYRNRFWTVGDHGAEFTTIPKGAIVFNHKQTAELFKNGKVTSDGGRGRMFANGTAFASGTAFAEGTDFNESFDWIEVVISRLERAISNLESTIDSSYRSWDSRESALTTKIGKINTEITKQNEAKAYYGNKANTAYNDLSSYANNLGYSNDYLTKITSGIISVQDIKDEKLAEKVKAYQDWYEKALAAEDAVIELTEDKMGSYAQYFDNVIAEYDGILQTFDHTESMLDEYISQAEAKGHIVSKNYYQALKDNKNAEIDELENQQRDLLDARTKYYNAMRQQGMSSKEIKNSQQWKDMCAEIDGVTQAIEQGITALIEYDNAMRDIDWEVFDLIQERIADVTAEADFLIDLMSNDKLFDDNGKLTDKGMATMGLHGQNYNTYMYQADDYGNQIKKLDSQIAQDPYDQELINRRRELIELQRESILAAEDEKNSIRDLVEEGINLELDALQERIDLHNEEIDSMKDLYDYQKQVKEQTEEIASIEKQLAAYANDDSEEAKSKIQELKVSLEDAKADLEESEYDRYISDQSALLDSLYEEYELILNQRLDNVDALLGQVITEINIAAGAEGALATALGTEGAIATALGGNANTIKTTLEKEADSVGATLSTAMKGIWSVDEGNAKSVLETYGKGFQDKQTTTNTVLGNIKADISRMVDDVDKDATTKVNANKTSSSSVKNPTGNITPTPKPTKPEQNHDDDNDFRKGQAVKFLSGQYYYDSQGKKPLGSKYLGKKVYITNINTAKWATHPYHISTGKTLGKGDLGWLKAHQIKEYAIGKKNFSNSEIAWTQEKGQEFIVRPSDGAILTPVAKGDSVLTHAASNNIWDMANSPADFIKDNLNLGTTNVPNNSTVQSNYTQNLDKVVFNFPNVKNYDEMLSAMQKDPNFERLLLSMTIDRLAGKSPLAKGKSIR